MDSSWYKDFVDHYPVLGVSPNADAGEIKQAYRKAGLRSHPDKCVDENKKKDAEELMKQINIAYETLSNPQRRVEYDFLRTWHVNQAAQEAEYEEGLGDCEAKHEDAEIVKKDRKSNKDKPESKRHSSSSRRSDSSKKGKSSSGKSSSKFTLRMFLGMNPPQKSQSKKGSSRSSTSNRKSSSEAKSSSSTKNSSGHSKTAPASGSTKPERYDHSHGEPDIDQMRHGLKENGKFLSTKPGAYHTALLTLDWQFADFFSTRDKGAPVANGQDIGVYIHMCIIYAMGESMIFKCHGQHYEAKANPDTLSWEAWWTLRHAESIADICEWNGQWIDFLQQFLENQKNGDVWDDQERQWLLDHMMNWNAIPSPLSHLTSEGCKSCGAPGL